MSNKKMGSAFERVVAEELSEQGFWVHIMAQKASGQPADVIAARNGKAYLIDCKHCSSKFDTRRLESNQIASMSLWNKCGNGWGWFAIGFGSRIYMAPLVILELLLRQSFTEDEIAKIGLPLESWCANAS